MRDHAYGSPYPVRAPMTAATRAASSEKNHTPGSPSGPLTYVRQLVSGNAENHGRGGRNGGRRPLNQNGVTPTQADASKVSTVSARGTSFATEAAGNRQCKNVRSHQR